jgi:hypothetical protein
MKPRFAALGLLAVATTACGGSDGIARRRDAAVDVARDGARGDSGKDVSGIGIDGAKSNRDAPLALDGAAREDGGTRDGPWYFPDAPTACHVDITPITPASLVNLTAGPTASLRVQGTVVWEQTIPFQPSWQWSVTRSDGKTIESKEVPGDLGQIQFSLSVAGRYDLTVDIGNGCTGTARALVQDSSTQFRVYHVRALPPDSVSAAIPYEFDVRLLAGSTSATRDIEFDTGAPVTIDPTAGSGAPLPVAVPSSIRIQSSGSTWVTSGRSSNQGPFRAVLDLMLEYQVLVVPDPSSDGSEDLPPYLLSRATSNNVKVDAQYLGAYANPLRLPRGVAVTGRLLGPDGPVEGATLSLHSYQSSTTAGQTDLVFSTVGRADSDGNYALRVNPAGAFSIVVAPPPGSDLPGATIDQAISITAPDMVLPAIDFQWSPLPTMDLRVAVTLPEGRAASEVAVHIEAAADESLAPGVLTARDDVDAGVDGGTGPWSPPPAVTSVRRDAITDRYGSATFAGLPRGGYNITLVPPAALGCGITRYKHKAGSQPTSDPVDIGIALVPKVMVVGRLLDAKDDLATDSAGTKVVATDLGHDTMAPVVATQVGADGSFVLALDPERTYSLYAQPVAGRGLPSYVPLYGFSTGRSLLQLDDQRIPKGVLVQGHVTYAGRPIEGAVLQVFCVGLAPDCADRTDLAAGSPPAFASGLSDGNGNYAFYLPDPATAE